MEKQQLSTPNNSNNSNVCFCKRPALITISIDNEIVCKNCGVTFGYDENDDSINTIPSYHITKSKLNLYQKRQKGGNPYDTKRLLHVSNLRLEKNYNNNTVNSQDAAAFADVCGKLKLLNITSESCWKEYCTLKRKKITKFTRAKMMCLAIYQTCRQNKIPFDEQQIRDVMCQSLGVKNAPMLKNIIFKIHQDDNSDCNESKDDKEDKSKLQFYLNQHISQAQSRHKLTDVTALQHLSLRYYENFLSSCLNANQNNGMMDNESCHTRIDYDTMAKRAVLLALQRCVVMTS